MATEAVVPKLDETAVEAPKPAYVKKVYSLSSWQSMKQ